MIDPKFINDVEREIKKFFGKIDMNAIMPEIGNLIDFAVTEQFETEGAYFGTKWAELALSTQKAREKANKSPTTNLLRFTNTLFNTLDYQISGNSLLYGTNLEYGTYLQYGTKFMPARPFLPIHGLPLETMKDIEYEVMQYLMRI